MNTPPIMNTQTANLPLPVIAPAETDDELALLLSEPFIRAWQLPVANNAAVPAVRSRLLERVTASRAAEAALTTARRTRVTRETLCASVVAQTLYCAPTDRAPRPGEPLRARLIELAAGAQLAPDLLAARQQRTARHCEWLVLSGSIDADGATLRQRDYQVIPAGHDLPALTSHDGALLFLRESEPLAGPAEAPSSMLDGNAGWADFAPGIQRRVLWQRAGQAALLYFVQPGTQVPLHRHGHDEECLMLQGDLFLDDILLRPGDYQLAPAGTNHRITETDTGVVLYVHGDLELIFLA